MELKFFSKSFNLSKDCVLIVPLWNWNVIEDVPEPKIESSNRTFMELKYKSILFII